MSNAYDENIDQKIVEEFQDVIIKIFDVLKAYGIEELHVGGLMRMLGVSPEVAELYDNHVLVAADLENAPQPDTEVDFSDIPDANIVNNTNPNGRLH
jgi:hypothetical protein